MRKKIISDPQQYFFAYAAFLSWSMFSKYRSCWVSRVSYILLLCLLPDLEGLKSTISTADVRKTFR